MKRLSLDEKIKACGGVIVIDGSMSTALENFGCRLDTRLWTAEILAEQPEKVKQVHMNYFDDGADCGITASYQASIEGLMESGRTASEAEKIICRSVEIFSEARDEWLQLNPDRQKPLCLGSCGPYGAYLADGSEYRGHYGVSDKVLRTFHRRRAELLWESGADLLLFETQPSLDETLIESEIAEEIGADYWISFSSMDGVHTCEGTSIGECAEILSEGRPHLRMIGVNCTQPKYVSSLLRSIKENTDLPVGVYPNSGEIYDPAEKTWSKDAEEKMSFGEYSFKWMTEGAAAVGGCCTTTDRHIRMVKEARDRFCRGPKTVSL
jgi:homocysteine S-methyltransferase